MKQLVLQPNITGSLSFFNFHEKILIQVKLGVLVDLEHQHVQHRKQNIRYHCINAGMIQTLDYIIIILFLN